jgi:hypothetical protein
MEPCGLVELIPSWRHKIHPPFQERAPAGRPGSRIQRTPIHKGAARVIATAVPVLTNPASSTLGRYAGVHPVNHSEAECTAWECCCAARVVNESAHKKAPAQANKRVPCHPVAGRRSPFACEYRSWHNTIPVRHFFAEFDAYAPTFPGCQARCSLSST